MKRRSWKFLLITCLLISISGIAQAITINASLSSRLTGSQIIYVSDLDLMRSGAGEVLFRVILDNIASTDRNIKLNVSLRNVSDTLASGWLDVDPTPSRQEFTNLNLSANSSKGHWKKNPDLSSGVLNQMLSTGMVPINTYFYDMSVTWDNGVGHNSLPAPSIQFQVKGMGYVSLSYPSNDPQGNNPVPTDKPFFVWNSTQSAFNITIAEIRPGEDPASALENREVCAASVTSKSFQYPSSGVIALRPGNYYAWQVVTSIETSHGNEKVGSEINVFRVAPVVTAESMQLMAALNQILSGSIGARLLDQIQNGNLTGEIYLNDQPITVQQLMAMIGSFSNGTYNIRNVSSR